MMFVITKTQITNILNKLSLNYKKKTSYIHVIHDNNVSFGLNYIL